MTVDPARIPRVPQLFAPTLKALSTLGGSASNDEIDDRVADILELTPDERAYVKEGSSLPSVNYRSAWARSWLKNAGLVENSARSVWTLTSEGRSAVEGDDGPALVKRVRQANYALRKGGSLSDDAAPQWRTKPHHPLKWREVGVNAY